jgi:hypothetical protein
VSYNIELITRLNAKHQQYRMGRGGTTDLTWDSIAAATRGLPQQHMILMHILRGAAQQHERMAFRSWLDALVLQKIKEAGDKPRRGLTAQDVATGITTIAIYSYLNAAGQCDVCGGGGLIASLTDAKIRALAEKYYGQVLSRSNVEMVNAAQVKCDTCGGTGVKPWQYRARLQMAGWLTTTSPHGPVKPLMTEDSYRKTWAQYERYANSLLKLLEKQAEDWILVNLGLSDMEPEVIFVD